MRFNSVLLRYCQNFNALTPSLLTLISLRGQQVVCVRFWLCQVLLHLLVKCFKLVEQDKENLRIVIYDYMGGKKKQT